MEVGLKVAVTPDGRGAAVKVIAELNVPAIVVVTVTLPFAPLLIEIVLGEA